MLGFYPLTLTGGGVTIEGAGITLRTTRPLQDHPTAIEVASSGNRLRGLTIEGFDRGVVIGPYWDWTLGGSMPTHVTLADNVIEGLVMRDIAQVGVLAWPAFSPDCGAPKAARCWSYTTWRNTTITGNTIESGDTGIKFTVNGAGDRIERATIAGNRVVVFGGDQGIGVETGGDSTRARISDVLIARNTVEGSVPIGINVASGTLRGQSGVVERVRVLDNRVHLVRRGSSFCCQGIVVSAGSDGPAFTTMVDPPRYLDGNLVRDVLIRDNSIGGNLQWGVQVVAAFGAGGRQNRIESVRIQRNTIRSSSLGTGVYLVLADGNPFRNRLATGNRIRDVSIDANRISIGRRVVGGRPALPGGVALQGGGRFGSGNSVLNVRITNNVIATSHVGISVVGGLGSPSRGNSVSCVRLSGNRVSGTRTGLAVIANQQGARGNRATLACR